MYLFLKLSVDTSQAVPKLSCIHTHTLTRAHTRMFAQHLRSQQEVYDIIIDLIYYLPVTQMA